MNFNEVNLLINSTWKDKRNWDNHDIISVFVNYHQPLPVWFIFVFFSCQHRYDYVQILDHNKTPVGSKICGKKYDELKVEVLGSTAYVVLYSDYEATEQGFTANFQAISAPKLPSKGKLQKRLIWRIIVYIHIILGSYTLGWVRVGLLYVYR